MWNSPPCPIPRLFSPRSVIPWNHQMSHFSLRFLIQDCRELPTEQKVSVLFAKGQNNLKQGGTCTGSKKIWHNYHVNYRGCFKSPTSKTRSFHTFLRQRENCFLAWRKESNIRTTKKTHKKTTKQIHIFCAINIGTIWLLSMLCFWYWYAELQILWRNFCCEELRQQKQ